MLTLNPVLRPQTPITDSNKHQDFLNPSDLKKLQVAKQKLQAQNVPDVLKMVSYLRISSSMIDKLQRRQGMTCTGLSCYSQLMQSLSSCHPQWWMTCFITVDGQLRSYDSRIEKILKPIQFLT